MIRMVLIASWLLAGGCASAHYTLLPANTPVSVGSLSLQPPTAWNEAPKTSTPRARKESRSWTVDGLNLNRLMVIPDVEDGSPIFQNRNKAMALPVFRSDMLPNELVELTESSIEKLLGEGQSDVKAEHLRPHRFGGRAGVMFDLDITLADGPAYRGLAGAFISDSHLNLLVYIAAEPYYFDKDLDSAREIIENAHNS